MSETKIFAVISLGWLGDTLLNSTLCQDIKSKYPTSKLIFIASKPFIDVAKGIPGVDEAYYFDKKNEHKGLFGTLKFANDFPYKNKVDTAFITHAQERSIMLGSAIGAKQRVAAPKKGFNPVNFLITHKRLYSENEIRNTYKANFNADYMKCIGLEPEYNEVFFNVPEEAMQSAKNKLNQSGLTSDEFTVLSPTSKDEYKDWSLENVRGFIQNSKLPTVLVGTGKAKEVAEKIADLNFIDMTNKTTIFELAAIYKMAKHSISVDTGTMHLSYSVGTPTLCMFFKETMVAEWAPRDREKNKVLIGGEYFNQDGAAQYKDISYSEVLGLIN